MAEGYALTQNERIDVTSNISVPTGINATIDTNITKAVICGNVATVTFGLAFSSNSGTNKTILLGLPKPAVALEFILRTNHTDNKVYPVYLYNDGNVGIRNNEVVAGTNVKFSICYITA